jgi:O-antigen/teichoic acid export membrane protein
MRSIAKLTQALPRRLLFNGGSIFAGEASARLATFGVAVVIARVYGPVALGQYGYAVAIASVLLLIPDSGLHLFIVKELAVEPERLRKIFWGVQWLKLPLLAAVLSFTFLFGQWTIHDAGRRFLLYLLVAKLALQTFSQVYMAVFKAFERMHYVAVQQLANTLLTAVCLAGALMLRANLVVVVLALVAGQALETWIGRKIVRKKFTPGSTVPWDGAALRAMLAGSAPIGIAAILQALNLRLDILTLSPFVSNSELGTYQAAAWFPVGAFLFVSLSMTAPFPKLARLLREPGTKGHDSIEGFLKTGVFLMTVGSIMIGLLAPYLLRGLFGAKLTGAFPILRILVVAFPCIFVNTSMFYVSVAARRRSAYLTALLVGVLAGGALSVALSAWYGPTGTALALVLREALVSAVFLCFLRASKVTKLVGKTLFRSLVCAQGAMVFLIILISLNVINAMWSIAFIVGFSVLVGLSRLQKLLWLAGQDL